MKKALPIFFLLACLQACTSKTETRIGIFDISKDDEIIIFTWYYGSGATILRVDIDGKNLQPVSPFSKDSSYVNPKYNEKGTKLLYIGRKNGDVSNSSVYIADADGGNRYLLAKESGIIDEAFFSSCDDLIYYIKSREFGNSSPVARPQPHGSDVYSLNIRTGKSNQITNFDAYGLYRPSEYDCQSMILHMPLKGMIKVPTDGSNKQYDINPINDPRKDTSLYGSPLFSKKNNILFFLAPYEMYTMKMKDRMAKLIIRDDDMINNFRLFNRQKKIIYTNYKENYFYTIDYNGKIIRKIEVDLNAN
ncbi:TolB family protein [Pedobacter changchengzhani]|nr:hypothetical protein [Pedobacter changchengzhani]